MFCVLLRFVLFSLGCFGLVCFFLVEGPIIIYFSRQIPAVMIPCPFQKMGETSPKCNGWNLKMMVSNMPESPFQGLNFRFDVKPQGDTSHDSNLQN